MLILLLVVMVLGHALWLYVVDRISAARRPAAERGDGSLGASRSEVTRSGGGASPGPSSAPSFPRCAPGGRTRFLN